MSEPPSDPPTGDEALPAPPPAPSALVDPALDAEIQADVLALDGNLWIPYTAVASIIRRIEGFMVHPVSDRMPGLGVVARSFNGKTSLLSTAKVTAENEMVFRGAPASNGHSGLMLGSPA